MDVMAGMAAVKQAYDLIKVIKESHDDATIKKAAGDLFEKITELQMLNAELSGLYQAEREVAVKLREEKTKIEMFTRNAQCYELHITTGGSAIYRFDESADPTVPRHCICAHCYQNHKISILQPSTKTTKSGGFLVHYCPSCKNEYRMGEAPPPKPVYVPHGSNW